MDKYTVRDTTGSIDVTASAAKYSTALQLWASTNEIAADRIATAVNTVLDTYPGQNIPMQALIGKSIELLDGKPEQFSALNKRVHAFVSGQATAGLLTVTKGKGGGVGRPVAAQ